MALLLGPIASAVIVVAVGNYLGQVFETGEKWDPLWWFLTYGFFIGLNVYGVSMSFKFTVVITFAALLILGTFYVGALPHFDLPSHAFDIIPDAGQTAFLPHGAMGVVAALPFAMWFYLAIEELPLAAEEAHDPVKDMPKGILLGLLTLVLCAFLTLIMSAGISPGAAALAKSEEPLFLGFRTIFGDGIGTKTLALVAVSGLVASLHSIIFAYGRQIYSLSRAGYFPRFLSTTHSSRQTPHVALLVGGALGYGVLLFIHWLGPKHPLGAVLLNMAVFGAVISYVLQMTSYILLRLKAPDLPRPYRSPLGIAGAVVAQLIALLTLAALFVVDPVYQKVAMAAAVWFLLGLGYFAFYGKNQLVYAPEEAFAESLLTKKS